MNTKVWYLPYFKGVYHTRMIETFFNANARMVHMVHTMVYINVSDAFTSQEVIQLDIPWENIKIVVSIGICLL